MGYVIAAAIVAAGYYYIRQTFGSVAAFHEAAKKAKEARAKAASV